MSHQVMGGAAMQGGFESITHVSIAESNSILTARKRV
jgi:hypothetical protein